MNWTRRQFLATGALAAAGASLVGCAASPKEVLMNPSQGAASAPVSDYFASKFGITRDVIDRVLGRALSRGGDWGELFFEHTRRGTVALLDGKVTQAYSGVELGMGVRCVCGEQAGYGYSESFLPEDLLAAADAAAAIAPGVRASDIRRRESLEFKRYYDLAIDWDALDVTRAVSLLQTIDAKARAKDPEIIQVQVTISWQQRTTMVNTSDGIDAFDNKPYYSLRMNTVIKHGEEIQSNGSNFADLDSFEAITPERVEAMIDEAIADTRILFEAVKPKGGEWPVVLGAGASGILLHEAIGHGLEADFNRKEASIFATKMNQRVASDEVTIYDSGLFEKSRGALNVDDEGTPGQKTVLVENGVLRSYLHDKISARFYGVAPTGNGRRESYKFYPKPRMRVTCMDNGTHEFEELIRGIKYGVYCRTFTNGQVYIGPGDYTFYVKNGFLIEDGKITAPIKDVNIIGNGPDTLSKITMVANDFQRHKGGWTCGKDGQSVPVSLGMPSVLVSSITVGGH